MDQDFPGGERDLRTAVVRGLRNCCPACGQARLFGRFLKPVPRCPACGQDWAHQQADDMPAYLVVLILGHIIVPIAVAVDTRFNPALWIEMLLWPGVALILAMLMIQPAKGVVIGFQWARRMHGFGRRR